MPVMMGTGEKYPDGINQSNERHSLAFVPESRKK